MRSSNAEDGPSLIIATQAVEAFRDEHGRLPESLEELGFPEGTVKYRVEGEEYELARLRERRGHRLVGGL